ncbi:eCIS core domain-containing protein [Algoriphagus aquimarinus]|uniref:eCIS core domain-containing protein n=1 Tax=Algoriphagus aquimarinus TaxID=237018 RepID=A0A1I1A7A7_9BACT|nr:DUF4157 domain-containing protein [Algoriphagus aquimarinus]SFB33402.1 protein of unknown function [Algoriphagus aquimarinus]
MHTHADKTQENKSQSDANVVYHRQSSAESTFQFVDNRPEAVAQRKLQEMANNSPQAKRATQLQTMADNHSAKQQQPIQKKENNTGLPDNLKSGIEQLSGYAMDDLKVYRNSSKPAQLQAHAYAQGADIHLGPGQEKHLAHEAWHVVQQKQGRVKPTKQLKSKANINDNVTLEHEADVMGARAISLGKTSNDFGNSLQQVSSNSYGPIQMAGHAGVMIFGGHPNGRAIFKRVEVNEYQEYQRVRNEQAVGEAPANNVFPRVFGTYTAAEFNQVGARINQGYNAGDARVQSWLEGAKAGDFYVEIESLGPAGDKVFDFKMGTSTVSREELERNHGKSKSEARIKKKKMGLVDRSTETSTLGLRDSDAAKGMSKWSFLPFKMAETLKPFKELISDRARDDGAQTPFLPQVAIDLQGIHDYFAQSDTVYIAASILVNISQGQAGRPGDAVEKAKFIDLAHPIRRGEDSFNKTRNRVLHGIQNLIRIVNRVDPTNYQGDDDNVAPVNAG